MFLSTVIRRFLSALVLVSLTTVDVGAQQQRIDYKAEVYYSTSSESRLPFWLVTNQFGVIDPSSSSGIARFGASWSSNETGLFSYRIGLDIVGRASDNNALFFQQFYGEARLGPFQLQAGKKERTTGETHQSLSLGSMLLSGNAAPVTQISLSWPDFVTIPGTGEFLGVRGYVGHGWIEGSRVVDDVLLHEKSLYLRLGMPDWPVEGRAGILHYTMWGGISSRPGREEPLPSRFSDFLRVFFIQGAADDFEINGEITNVLGNSLGAYDFSLRVYLPSVEIIAYRQFYLEDTVSLAFRNGWDGMWGLGFSFVDGTLIQDILWEHVNTKRQSSKKDEPRGTDNYYNHFVYESGWTHRGLTLGIPLVLTGIGYEGVVNNIVLGHHVAIQGELGRSSLYKLMLTYSRNYGAHSILNEETFRREVDSRFIEPVHRFALLFEGSSKIFPQHKVDAFARIGYDWGDSGLVFPENNLGITIGLKKEGIF